MMCFMRIDKKSMKNNNICFIIALLLILGCSKNESSCNFRIINQSGYDLNYIEISNNFDKIRCYDELKENDTLLKSLNFSKNLPMGDGNYVIKYANKSDDTITHSFGYYTNAKPSNKFAYQISINKDSIKVEEY